MTNIGDLKGFSYPLTPNGKSSVVGDLPWHFASQYINITYRADPDAIAAYLPDPLEPGDEPDVVNIAFSKWWSVWDNQTDMVEVNPERTFYRETIAWVGCSYKGEQGRTCVLTWVDNDFTLARGWFMGFPKKLGVTIMSDPNPLNPRMDPIGPGSKLKGFVSAHGERLAEGMMTITGKGTEADLPTIFSRPVINLRHFPSLVPGAAPSVLELVKLNGCDLRTGDVWLGDATLKFFPSEVEEHMAALAPIEVLGAQYYSNGSTVTGGEVLHSWV